jgi:hypothetical protein
MILFRENDHFAFPNLGTTMINLFRAATLEDWTDIMYTAWYGCDNYAMGPNNSVALLHVSRAPSLIYFLLLPLSSQPMLSPPCPCCRLHASHTHAWSQCRRGAVTGPADAAVDLQAATGKLGIGVLLLGDLHLRRCFLCSWARSRSGCSSRWTRQASAHGPPPPPTF